MSHSFGLIGAGWRGEFYLRIARDLAERFPLVGVVVHTAEKRGQVRSRWGVATFANAEELIATQRPSFIVTCVPPEANLPLLESLASHHLPVLSETPMGRTLQELRRVAALTKAGARIQVAEQYHLQPMHATRLRLVRDGRLGAVHEADVSCAHGYHGVSLLRRYLQTGLALPKVSARSFTSREIKGPFRGDAPKARALVDTRRIIAQLDWGDRLGIYDFTFEQYFSWIRSPRVLVRAEEGEIKDAHVRLLKDFRTPLDFSLVRQDTGHDGNLEGYYLRSITGNGEVLYNNAFAPARWSDDEIACATALEKMQRYVESGEDFYGVAEACHDCYLDFLIAEAVQSGRLVQAAAQPWI
jgi:hypothetical protein